MNLLALPLILAATLPGFRLETVADVPGVVSSIVTDSRGTIYATATSGWIYRIDHGDAVPVASLPTHEGGNGGLLGMALLDDHTAAVHYTTWSGERVLDDVVSTVDFATGAETVLHSFACDIEVRERGASDEHHGGNPTIGENGEIFVGIGEYNDFELAQKPEWNGGKIFRLDRSGNVVQFARGVRNPYDLAWDPDLDRLVLADNGPVGGDELHVIEQGANCGWPDAIGNGDYVFPQTVAPTGLVRLKRDANAMLRRGYLVGAFVTRALYYFPDLASRPIADPLPIASGLDQFVIDVTQAPNGDIYLATMLMSESRIQRLHVPARGDCNGDGFADYGDLGSLTSELEDGNPHPTVTAQDGSYPGAWGCDVNSDSLIDSKDLSALTRLLSRRRAVRK